MSFGNVLKSIGHVLGVVVNDAAAAAPLISLIPGVDPAAATVIKSIFALEQLIPLPGNGPQKKANVVSIVNAVHPGLDQAKLSASIDKVVTLLNSLDAALNELGIAAPPPV